VDAFANFAISTVATAPSPATSGPSVTVATGDGANFPTPPFQVTVWPAAPATPTMANAEIGRCTAVAGDVLTIVRAQEGTSARSIVAGDQIMAGVTAGTLMQVRRTHGILPEDAGYAAWTMHPSGISATQSMTSGTVYVIKLFLAGTGITKITNIVMFHGTGSGLTAGQNFAGLYNSSGSLLASTADQSTNWATQGQHTMALSSPQDVTGASWVWIAYLGKGTTPPVLHRGSNQTSANLTGSTGTNMLFASANTGQSSLPGTLGTLTAVNSWPFVGVS
jgi:hypothetical protein